MSIYRNVEDALIDQLQRTLRANEYTIRGSKVREVLGVQLTITSPLERYMFLEHRNDNPFHKVAETMWVLGGHNDMKYLANYLPRAIDWSDDGKVWRAGYGPRIRNWYGSVDQIREVLKILHEDRYSRRALISIFDPMTDFQESKDIPCNNTLQFLIRPENGVDKLYMIVNQRSCDVLWGFSGINAFEWSYLHQFMAYWTNSSVGELIYNIGSMHLYEQHYERAQKILDAIPINSANKILYNHVNESSFTASMLAFPSITNNWFEYESLCRTRDLYATDCKTLDNIWKMYSLVPADDLIKQSMQMIFLYNLYKDMMANSILSREDYGLLASFIEKMSMSDAKFAAIAYFTRMLKKHNITDNFYKSINLSNLEYSILSNMYFVLQ